MKYSTEELLVACRVFDYAEEIEPFVQYETFGLIEHHILIDPKRMLVRKDEEGSLIDCRNDEVVYVQDYSSSFKTNSSPSGSLILSGYPLGPLSHLRKEYIRNKTHEVQFLMTLKDYIKQKTGLEIERLSLRQAKAIIKMLNLSEGKVFELSFDENEAKEQIDTTIYKMNSEQTKRSSL
ncbi:MAG: hypothetical protein II625_05455 [Bacilli bacterium]|nr:hypothetical protein [Bacilli bacterium]